MINIFKKDIYSSLRPKKDNNSFFGFNFPEISDIEYKDALIYPRFKFIKKDEFGKNHGVFETSDYKKLFQILGNIHLCIGAIFNYEKNNLRLKI